MHVMLLPTVAARYDGSRSYMCTYVHVDRWSDWAVRNQAVVVVVIAFLYSWIQPAYVCVYAYVLLLCA